VAWSAVLPSPNLEHLHGAAIPEIRRLISDEALRDYWLSGAAGGLSERQRISKLQALLRAIGPVDKLAEADSDTSAEPDREFDSLVTRVLRDAGFTQAQSAVSTASADVNDTDQSH
jgi:hypothetical protein